MQNEIAELRRQLDSDKERWEKEKVDMQDEIAELRRQLESRRQADVHAAEESRTAAEATRRDRDAARHADAERTQREEDEARARTERAQAETEVQAQDQRRPAAPSASATGNDDDGFVYIHDDPVEEPEQPDAEGEEEQEPEESEELEEPEPTPQPTRNANGKRLATARRRKGPKKPKLSEIAPSDEGAIAYYPNINTSNDTALLSSFADLSSAVRRGWDRFSKKNKARVSMWMRNRTPGYCVFSYTMSMRPGGKTEESRACKFCLNNGYPCVVSTEGTPDLLLCPAPSTVGDEKAGYSYIK